MIKLFAVRNVHSGKMLPATKKGYTTTEPEDPLTHPPRLHKSERSARMAMYAWARGKHIATWECWSSDDPYSSAGGMYVDEMRIQPIRGRILDHMEVVVVHMHIEPVDKR